MTFCRITYDDLLSGVEETARWCGVVGIDIRNTRFERILENNRIIIDHIHLGDLDGLLSKYDTIELWYSLTEATTYLEIFEVFRKEKSHFFPRRQLQKFLRGPFLAWDEDPESNNIEGRNTLFELESGAVLHQSGMKIIGFDDVDFQYKSHKFNVQCKRFHGTGNIEENIDKAARQFNAKYKDNPKVKGIICLSIDKIVGNEQMLLRTDSPHAVGAAMNQTTGDFVKKYRHLWRKFVNINILGVMIFYHALAIIDEKPYGLLTTCRQIDLDITPMPTPLQINDYLLIREMGEKIKAAR